MKFRYWIAVCLGLSACGAAPERYTVPAPEIAQRVAISYSSVEVRDVSLPSYAASDEIHIEAEGGALESSSAVLWADTPERAVSLALARNLAELTRAKVANEPWPFDSFPQAKVEVRVEDMIAARDGVFRLTGQYFVAPTRGTRERASRFAFSAPYDPAAGAASVAQARAQVILQLADDIARNGLR